MNEKEFEDILSKYPELIEKGLKFKGRQISVGGKFVDLLFEDRHGHTLIVELKKGAIKREHIAQLLDYEGYFLSPDDPTARVMLIGNRVPPNLRRALDHHGFEWKDISVSSLRNFLKERDDKEFLAYFSGEEFPKKPKKRRTGSKQKVIVPREGRELKIMKWDKFPSIVGIGREIGALVEDNIGQFGKSIDYKTGYSFIVAQKTIGKLVPDNPDAPVLMVGFSKALSNAKDYARRLGKPEKRSYGLKPQPFWMVQTDPSSQKSSIVKVMTAFIKHAKENTSSWR